MRTFTHPCEKKGYTMKTKFAAFAFLAVVLVLATVAAAPAPPPAPNVTFTVLTPLPETMTAGQTYDFVVQVTSDTPFISATALPDMYYPGRYVAAHGASRSGADTSATLTVTWTAKDSTAGLPGGVAPVAVVAGVRFQGGVVVSQRFDYNVSVP